MQHILKSGILLLLSLHAIGFILSMIDVLGFPGEVNQTALNISVTRILNILLLCAWRGIPMLILGSVAAFYFKYDKIGKVFCFASLAINLSLVVTLSILYKIKG